MIRISPHTFRYPLFDVYLDYLKTLFGVFIGAGGILYGLDNIISRLSFGAILLVFLFFGLHSYRRHKTVVTLDRDGIEFAALKTKKMAWKDIEIIELRYFGRPVKDKDADKKPKGVLNLILKSEDQKITLDSSLYGFRYLVWCSTLVAKEYKAPLDPGTVGNMLDIGLDSNGDSEMPDPKMTGF